VLIAGDGTMFCNCYTFESVGHYCAHQVCIATLVHEANCVEFHGFTHHDICLWYQTAYMHLAYRPETPEIIMKGFHALADNEMLGPKLKVEIPEEMPIEEVSPNLSTLDPLKNYQKEDVDLSKVDGLHTKTHLFFLVLKMPNHMTISG